ncbi:hydroxyacylglutathione hydrolase [Colwellia psychrerythraea]|uniref:Hydroxyacylglutathione hydrolase n=1 Tax=Colwellia psychrerythraea TaxID=28229 RepID=A0A099KHT6_COLPS|nr:hydroxyacylglutathione hydrolase [Colwellia psychrerythraea]KGJ89931.1 Hydroxyacylglutathione hydrolase [Colwellia psychrerythraea]
MSNTHHIVTAIQAFNDNYIWALAEKNNDKITLIDPGDAGVCIDYLQESNLVLSNILITHHHSDHVGGIKNLLEYAKLRKWQVTVYGPASENIAQLDITLKEGDAVTLADTHCQLNVLDLPGHTKGHIAYYNKDILFCGDTLFSGGCGRLFEGTPEQMHHSLSKLASLPANTLIYCAHEYTQANLAFALAVEPDNNDLHKYSELVALKRDKNQASIPSNIALERQINPFLRCHEPAIKQAAQAYSKKKQTSDSEVFSVIRAWKDNF